MPPFDATDGPRLSRSGGRGARSPGHWQAILAISVMFARLGFDVVASQVVKPGVRETDTALNSDSTKAPEAPNTVTPYLADFTTPGVYSWQVPESPGFEYVKVLLYGAGGAGGGGTTVTGSYSTGMPSNGGNGGFTSCILPVRPDQVLFALVGSGGQNRGFGVDSPAGEFCGGGAGRVHNGDRNWAAGSGGGRSSIQLYPSKDVGTAGGGGGGFGYTNGRGLCGGGLNGCSSPDGYTMYGGGGNQTAGGAGGYWPGNDHPSGESGTFYQGGDGAPYGGGGGGGYYGGGGGGWFSGGGGGSGYIEGCLPGSYSVQNTTPNNVAYIGDTVRGVGLGGTPSNNVSVLPGAGGNGRIVILPYYGAIAELSTTKHNTETPTNSFSSSSPSVAPTSLVRTSFPPEPNSPKHPTGAFPTVSSTGTLSTVSSSGTAPFITSNPSRYLAANPLASCPTASPTIEQTFVPSPTDAVSTPTSKN